MAQYTNKRNRFLRKLRLATLSDQSLQMKALTKAQLTEVAQSIGMKGIPSWVLKDHKSAIKGCYDLKTLLDGVDIGVVGWLPEAPKDMTFENPNVASIVSPVRCGSVEFPPSDQQNDPATPLTDAL